MLDRRRQDHKEVSIAQAAVCGRAFYVAARSRVKHGAVSGSKRQFGRFQARREHGRIAV